MGQAESCFRPLPLGSTSYPSSQQEGAPDPGLEFVEAWAALVQSLDRSPARDGWDDECLSAALAARDAAAGAGPLRVLFARDEVRVAGRRHTLACRRSAAALAEALEACGIAGVLFEPGLRAPSLLAFSRQVREGSRRAALEFENDRWQGEPLEHVHVLQARFQGAFDAALGETARRPLAGLRSALESLQKGALDDSSPGAEQLLRLVRDAELDSGTDDDVAALKIEIAEFATDKGPGRAVETLADTAESLDVFLHLLATLENESELAHLHAPLASLVHDAGEHGRAVFASHLSPRADDDRGRRRLTSFLCDFDLVSVLVEHGAFDTALAAECFPDGFHLWLSSLDLAQAGDHARLCEVLERVGPQRVLSAGPRLFGEARLGDLSRAAALLSRPHQALVPVARLLLARGVPALTERVAGFVRGLDLDVPEARLFALLDDAELPAEVLAGLLDPPRSASARESLRARAAECLCELVERPLVPGAREGRRLAAARLLAELGAAPVRARIEAWLRDASGEPELAALLRRALEDGA